MASAWGSQRAWGAWAHAPEAVALAVAALRAIKLGEGGVRPPLYSVIRGAEGVLCGAKGRRDGRRRIDAARRSHVGARRVGQEVVRRVLGSHPQRGWSQRAKLLEGHGLGPLARPRAHAHLGARHHRVAACLGLEGGGGGRGEGVFSRSVGGLASSMGAPGADPSRGVVDPCCFGALKQTKRVEGGGLFQQEDSVAGVAADGPVLHRGA